MSLHLFFRKSRPGFFSIENVFQNVLPTLEQGYPDFRLINVPKTGAGLPSILTNIKYALKNKGHINHITGDVHYLALVTGKNTVLTIHDIGSALEGGLFKKYYIRIFWFYLPVFFAKHITVISKFTKKQLVELMPSAKSKITVIPNAVNAAFVYQPKPFNQKKPTILCVGTKPNKNLLRIFNSLKDISCRVFIIGKLNKAQQHSLDSNGIEYTNKANLTNQEVVKAYRDCDILCFPSLYEGFGMPIIEAQSTGRAVITSNFGAMKEVSKHSSCLVDPYEVSSIRAGIQKVIKDETYRNHIIQKGLDNAKCFQVDSVAKQYLNLYRSMSI